MTQPETTDGTVRFGAFAADLNTMELYENGIRVRVPRQSFEVLGMLLERPGDLVTREQLQRKLWPGHSFGDFEHGLNAAVNRLRDALTDSADAPKFVETVPRRGYRFIGSLNNKMVSPLPAEAASEAPSQNSQAEEFSSPSEQKSFASKVFHRGNAVADRGGNCCGRVHNFFTLAVYLAGTARCTLGRAMDARVLYHHERPEGVSLIFS